MKNAVTRIALATAVLGLVAGATRQAAAGLVTATLSANPSTINEGGSTTLTLSLHDTPIPYNVTSYNNSYSYWVSTGFNSGYWQFVPNYGTYGYNGNGYISYIGGSINPGGGQNSVGISAFPNSTDASIVQAITYPTAGNFTASATGTVYTQDYYVDTYTNWYGYHDNSGYRASSSSLFASTDIHVNNLSPTITKINWTPDVLVGQTFNFSAEASDPGLAGGETLTFAFDLNGTGTYSDFVQSGGTSDGGTYQFDTSGLHHVGIKVTDSLGASTYGSFDVLASDPAAPEPATLLSAGIAGLLGLGYTWRRQRKAKAKPSPAV